MRRAAASTSATTRAATAGTLEAEASTCSGATRRGACRRLAAPSARPSVPFRGADVRATRPTSLPRSGSIKVYTFPRASPDIPADLLVANASTLSPASWTVTPAANFSIPQCDNSTFNSHAVVLNTALCGDLAGNTWAASGCEVAASTCALFVKENAGAFTDAFWGIRSLKIYTADGNTAIVEASSAFVRLHLPRPPPRSLESSQALTRIVLPSLPRAQVSSALPRRPQHPVGRRRHPARRASLVLSLPSLLPSCLLHLSGSLSVLYSCASPPLTYRRLTNRWALLRISSASPRLGEDGNVGVPRTLAVDAVVAASSPLLPQLAVSGASCEWRRAPSQSEQPRANRARARGRQAGWRPLVSPASKDGRLALVHATAAGQMVP